MTFITDAWYCAGFSDDVTRERPYAITLLAQPLVLFRTDEGPVALVDRCPHRFAPLSRGRIVGDTIQCGYHGVAFDSKGSCVRNPNGPIPPAARVTAFTVMEKYGAIWVWMGDPAVADPARLPDFSATEQSPRITRVTGRLHIHANYQLVIDNLLDLSHVPFLHPFLASTKPPPPEFSADVRTKVQGDTVFAINEFHHMPVSDFYRMLWEGAAPETCDMRANMRWDPPSHLFLDTGAAVVGRDRASGPSSPQGHWLTPETETTTHYFWAVGRDRQLGDSAFSEQLRTGIQSAFQSEDEPMIEAVQQRMGDAEFWSEQPLLFATDSAAVRARRIVAKMLSATGGGEHVSVQRPR